MRSWKAAGRGCLSLFLMLCLAFPVYGTKSDMTEARKKRDTLAEEKKKAQETLAKLESLKADTAAYVKQLDENLGTLNLELTFLEKQIDSKEEEIFQAQTQLEEAAREEENQYDSMKLRIKYLYEKNQTGYLEILMGSESLSQLLNRAEYIQKLTEYDRSKLNQYIEMKQAIAKSSEKLELEKEQLLELQETTAAKQSSVEQLQEAKTQELAGYGKKINQAQGEISEYQKSMEAEENRMKEIEAEIKRNEEKARKAAEEAGKKYNTVNIGNISFIWPCPASGRITSNFGDRESPTEGASSDHQGIDIGAATGTNILAAAAGEVTISTYSYSAGNYIMINHGGGVYTVYMHCSQLLAGAGDLVSQGQVIAKVGSTGYSTGSHLHFGVRLNGSYVNPLKYVSP